MATFLGDKVIENYKVGANQVNKIMLAGEQVYPVVPPNVILHGILDPVITDPSLTTITVYGTPFQIDWGDGIPISYLDGEDAQDGSQATVDGGYITVTTNNPELVTKFDIKQTDILSSLTLSHTTGLTDMSSAFSSQRRIQSINFVNIDTSNVTNMALLFADCRHVQTYDLSLFDTRNVTDMSNMFLNNASLPSLAFLPAFDLSSASDLSGMFFGCDGFTNLDGLSILPITNQHSLTSMFRTCLNLQSADLSSIDFSSGRSSLTNFFQACPSLTNVTMMPMPVSSLYTSFDRMFEDCTSLICITHINTLNASSVVSMFRNTPALVAPDAADQALITGAGGYNYINPDPCP